MEGKEPLMCSWGREQCTCHPRPPPPGPSPAQAPTSILTKGTALPRGLRRTRAGGSGAREDVPAAKWLTLSGTPSFICTWRAGPTPQPHTTSHVGISGGCRLRSSWAQGMGPRLKMEASLQKILGVLFSVVLSFSLFSHLSKFKKKRRRRRKTQEASSDWLSEKPVKPPLVENILTA